MASFFQLIEELQHQISLLNTLIYGDENSTVIIDGENRPTIARNIKEQFSELRALINGRIPFETRAQLDSSGAPANGELAEVWDDSNKGNNGLYGYKGGQWVKSTYDLGKDLNDSFTSLVSLVVNRAVDSNVAIDENGNYAILSDEDGRVALSVNSLGELLFNIDSESAKNAAKKAGIDNRVDPDIAFAIVDELSRIALSIDKNGRVKIPSLESTEFDINHFLIRGQSLSRGYNSKPSLTLSENFGNLTFNNSVRSTEFTQFTPLVEGDDGNDGESPAAGIAAQIRSNTIDPFSNVDPKMFGENILASIHSLSGASIDQLNKGTSTYQQSLDAVRSAYEISKNENLSYSFNGIFWIQGEQNERERTPRADYKAKLIQLKNDHLADIKEILERPWLKFPFVVYQTAHRYQHTTPITALAQLDAAEEDVDIFLATPIYYLPVSDHTHMTPHSSRWLGEQLGKVWNRIKRGENWRPLSLQKAKIIEANKVLATFYVPNPPLVLDELLVTNPGNFGFELADDNGDVVITEVKLVSDSQVEITTSRNISTNPYLRYAYTSYGNAGPITGARGNLRDSDNTTSRYLNANGEQYPLYNWCVTFDKKIEV